MKSTLFGLAVNGPMNHYWFTTLDKVSFPVLLLHLVLLIVARLCSGWSLRVVLGAQVRLVLADSA